MKRYPFQFSRLVGILALLALLLAACGPTQASPTTQATQSAGGNEKTTTQLRVVALPSATATSAHPSPTLTPASTPTVPATPTPASMPTAQATPTTAAGGPQWQLVLSDDFTGTQLGSQWITYGGPHGGGTSYYDPSELKLQDGILHIMMEQKTTGGRAWTTGGMGAMRLASTYGKYEFRARLPRGKGVGPYAILWPNDSGHGDVEVDLFESPPMNKDKVYFTNHGNGDPSQIIAPGNFADAFHTFTYEWTPGKLHFMIDGVDQGTLTKNVPNFPMWFGIAVACGDAFTGSPDSTTVLPVSLDVDWVHIYKYIGG